MFFNGGITSGTEVVVKLAMRLKKLFVRVGDPVKFIRDVKNFLDSYNPDRGFSAASAITRSPTCRILWGHLKGTIYSK